MDESRRFLEIIAGYRGKRVFVGFNSGGKLGVNHFEGIMGDIFSDGFSVIIGKKKQATRICYLRSIAFVQLLED